MDLSEEIKESIKTSANGAHLDRLSTFLNYELSSSTFYLGAFFYRALLFIAVLAAIVFTPYLIYVLFLEKRYGWLIFFFLIVILPLISFEIFISDPAARSIARWFPIGAFFFYCLLLKYTVNDWIRERSFRQMWEAEKMLKKK